MIKRLFENVIESISTSEGDGQTPEDREAALRMATVVLMVDVALADHVFDDSELDRVLRLVESHFELSAEEAAELADAATAKAEEMVSLHDFIQLLNEHLTDGEKTRIIDLLWQIAYADGELDKYENSLILKISDLLYVSRGRVMRLKHDAGVAANAIEA